MWQAPNITLQWGPYFKVEVEEQAKQIEMAAKAVESGLATKRMALELLRSVLKIESIDAVLEQLEKEAAEREAKQFEAAHKLAELNGDDGEDDDGGAGSGTGEDPPKPARGGSGGLAAAKPKAQKAPPAA